MDTAETALVIAIAGAAISILGLVWQLALYRMSGCRLDVRLTPMVLDSHGNTATGADGGFGSKPLSGLDDDHEHEIELARVRVTNIGRTAVALSNISLDFGRRRSPCVTALSYDRSQADENLRLEPGEAVERRFDLWQVVGELRATRPGTLRVRASVQPAGRRRTRSNARQSWRIRAGQESVRGQALSPEARAFVAFWREVRTMAPDHATVLTAYKAVRPIIVGEQHGNALETLKRILQVEEPPYRVIPVLTRELRGHPS